MKKGIFRIFCFTFLFFMLAATYCFSQQQIQWGSNAINKNKFAGDHTGKYIKKDAHGNIYVAGTHTGYGDYDPSTGYSEINEEGSTDLFIAKYDSAGNYIFAFSLGQWTVDLLYGFTVDDNGNVYISGNYQGFDLDPSPLNTVQLAPYTQYSTKTFIASYDSLGNYRWAHLFNNIVSQCLETDTAGNLFVGGNFINTADFDPGPGAAISTSLATNYDAFIAEYDGSGNYIFHKTFGGMYPEYINELKLNLTGKIYITGNFQSVADFDPSAATANLTASGGTDVFIAAYTTTGNYLFAKKLGGTADDDGLSLDLGTDGKIYACGFFNGTADLDGSAAVANVISVGGKDVFITGYDTLGNYVFGKGFGGSSDDRANSVSVNSLNRIFITGSFTNSADFDPSSASHYIMANGLYDENLFTAGYDPTGNYIFAKSFGGLQTDGGYSIQSVGNASFLVTGTFYGPVDFDPGPSTQSLQGPLRNVCMAKYDANGNYIFAKEMGCLHGTQKDDEGRSIISDAAGNIYVCGAFSDTTDFDPGPAVYNLVQYGITTNMFVAKYSPAGAFLFAFSVGNTTGTIDPGKIALDASGNILVFGDFTGTLDFNPSATVNNLVSNGGGVDLFFAKYTSSGNFISVQALFATTSTEMLMDFYRDSISGEMYVATGCNTCSGMTFAKFSATGTLIFQKTINSIYPVQVNAIRANATGEIFIAGVFQSQCDFDPSSAVHNLTSGSASFFLAKYDSGGNYVFAYGCDGTMSQDVKTMEMDDAGDIYITGTFLGTADMDFSAGVYNLYATSSIAYCFLAKYSQSGQLKFAFSLGSTDYVTPYDLLIPAGSKIYLTGLFRDTLDFDPSAGNYSLGTIDYRNPFLAVYDTLGNFISAVNAVKGDNAQVIKAINITTSGEILATGFIEYTADLDPTSSVYNLRAHNSSDYFLGKYSNCPQPNLVATAYNACYSQNNGSIALNASSNSGLSFAWAPSGGNGPVASNLAPGIYTCVVTNSCGFSDTLSATVLSNPQIIVNVSQTNIFCNGNSDGNAMLGVSGGSPGYQYNWNSPLGAGASLTNAPAGNYSCIITDVMNCQLTQTLSLTEPSPLNISESHSDPTSCISTDGQILLTVSGGTPGYSFLWNNASATNQISGVGAGIYSCTITDQNNCTMPFNDTLHASSPYPSVTLNLFPDFLCSGTNAVTLSGETPVGGTWSGPFVNNGSFDPSASGIGTFIVTYSYTDSTGCTSAVTDTLLVDACMQINSQVKTDQAFLYPNPASDEFYINSSNTGLMNLYNSMGQLLLSRRIDAPFTTIPLENIRSGIYSIVLITDKGPVWRNILIVAHD
jgi:hypothetical protein